MTNDDFGDDDQREQVDAIERRAGPYKPEEGPLTFTIPTEQVLSEDILAEPPKNRAARERLSGSGCTTS